MSDWDAPEDHRPYGRDYRLGCVIILIILACSLLLSYLILKFSI